MKSIGILGSLLAAWTLPACAATCEGLSSLALPQAKITSARVVAAGAFTPPAGRAEPYRTVPEFCRVTATLTPSTDSDIKVEVWLPTIGWNRKLEVVGNGGWAGTISYPALADAVRGGYAAASTDTGHSTPGGSFVAGHPEKLVDFSWRSEHETTVKAKAVVEAFYGGAPRRSYWNGCSTGGRQALKEAQMFPDDFDGIIAGAPGNRTAMGLWIAHAALKDPASHIPPAKFPLIHQAALAACDAADGLKDGLISDPARCRFDLGVLLCKEGDRADCLTAAQGEAARKIYGPGRNPRTGKELFGSLAPGSELGWAVMAAGPEPYGPILDQAKYVVFQDPNWDWRTFDFDKDNDRFERHEYLIMNATDPHIEKFVARGGKLLMYHGWADQNVSPYMTVDYFQRVREALGPARTDGSVRLFMAPGMAHCSGGEGPNTFDKIGVLDRWVEEGKPPASIVASHSTGGKVDRTRPLCPYPQQAVYKGSGSIDDAANFVCAESRNTADAGRPPLFFREDFQETPAATPITQEHLTNANLVLTLYGPGREGMKKSHHDTPADDPYYIWDGTCAGNCAATLRDKASLVDLSGLAKIRWRTKQSGFRRLHLIVKLASGAWLVGNAVAGASSDWQESEAPMRDIQWRQLDIRTLVEGAAVERPQLDRVDEIGWSTLMTGGGTPASSRVDWIEVYGRPAPRGAASHP